MNKITKGLIVVSALFGLGLAHQDTAKAFDYQQSAKDHGIPLSTKYGSLREDSYVKYHAVVYGKMHGPKLSGEYQYMGYNASGEEIPNPAFPEYNSAGSYFDNDNIFSYPWAKDSSPYLKGKATTMPDPVGPNSSGDWALGGKKRQAVLSNVYDTSTSSPKWKNLSSLLYSKASIISKPVSDYDTAVIITYNEYSGCSDGYYAGKYYKHTCYGVWFGHIKDPVTSPVADIELKNEVAFDTTSGYYSNGGIDSIRITMKNNKSIEYDKVKIRYYWEGDSTKYCEVRHLDKNEQRYAYLGASNDNKCSSTDPDPTGIKFPKTESSGKYSNTKKLIVELDPYDTFDETDEDNNDQKFSVTVNGLNVTASASIPKTKYENIPFDITVNMTNNMKLYTVDAPCDTTPHSGEAACNGSTTYTSFKYYVKNSSGTVVKSASTTFTDLANGSTKSLLINDLKLPAGSYTLYVYTPHYDNEYNYTDNQYTVKFSVIVNKGDVSVDAWVRDAVTYDQDDIHEGEDFYIRSQLSSTGFLSTIKAPCSLTDAVKCNDDATKTYNWKWTWRIKKGFDATYPLADSTPVLQGVFPATSVAKESDSDYQYAKNLKLPAGNYTLWVHAPYYDNEGDYDDNLTSVNFTVKPVDVELERDDFLVDPTTGIYSTAGIDKVQVTIKNNTDKAMENVKIYYQWEGDSTVYCEYRNLGANEEKHAWLGANNTYACNGTTPTNFKFPKTGVTNVYKNKKNLIVTIDGDNSIDETDEDNNQEVFAVYYYGLNAYADGELPDTMYDQIPFDFKIKMDNDMKLYYIGAPCATTVGLTAMCNGSTPNKNFSYSIKNSSGMIVKSGTYTFSGLADGDEKTVDITGVLLDKGDYTLNVYAPHYDNEYNYLDNTYVQNFTVSPVSVDLQLLNTFSVTPAPAHKSDEPIDPIKIQIKNVSIKKIDTAYVTYYWKDDPTNVMCEDTVSMDPGATVDVWLSNGVGGCPGFVQAPRTAYPRYKDLSEQKLAGLVVNVNYNKSIEETNYTNNVKTFNVLTQGLNAFIENTTVTYNSDTQKASVATTIRNNMRKMLSAPCLSSDSSEEKCLDSTLDHDLTYQLYDADGNLVKTWTKTYNDIVEYGSANISSTIDIPPGDYKLVTTMPEYLYEYDRDDNKAEYGFSARITPPANVACGGPGAKLCAGVFPKYPSTKAEGGSGVYFYIGYKMLPDPIVPNYINTSATERGRMLAKDITFNYKVVGPDGNDIPGAAGTVKYNVPGTCYNDAEIVYDPELKCQELNFYAPNSAATVEGSNTPPSEFQKYKFNNPGVYKVVVTATENQVYYYQISTSPGVWGPVKQGTLTGSNNYTYSYSFKVTGISSGNGF